MYLKHPIKPTLILNSSYAKDICLSDNLCQYTHAGNPGGSGYYTSGCTDPDFKDSSCQPACQDQTEPDAAYDYDEGRWSCCGFDGTTRHCSDPLGSTFDAPAPGDLSSIAVIVAASSAASYAASSINHTPVPTITQALRQSSGSESGSGTAAAVTGAAESCPAVKDSSSGGVSTGAVAGLGAVVGVLALTLIALGVLLFLEKRKSKRALEQMRHQDIQMGNPTAYSVNVAGGAPEKSGLMGGPVHRRGELDEEPSRHGDFRELPG